MRDLEEFTDAEVLEVIEHGLDEYEGAEEASLCFMAYACISMLGRICDLEQLAPHLDHIREYVEEAQRLAMR